METQMYETTLTTAEVREFTNLCVKQNVELAKKVGELIHGFVLAEGVKHLVRKIKSHRKKLSFTHRCKTPFAHDKVTQRNEK